MEYECIKEKTIPLCDGDGFTIENKYGYAIVGSKWYRDDISSICGGEVHLEAISGCEDFGWIEISKESLDEYFRAIKSCNMDTTGNGKRISNLMRMVDDDENNNCIR